MHESSVPAPIGDDAMAQNGTRSRYVPFTTVTVDGRNRARRALLTTRLPG